VDESVPLDQRFASSNPPVAGHFSLTGSYRRYHDNRRKTEKNKLLSSFEVPPG
jgi:hypothetical protein